MKTEKIVRDVSSRVKKHKFLPSNVFKLIIASLLLVFLSTVALLSLQMNFDTRNKATGLSDSEQVLLATQSTPEVMENEILIKVKRDYRKVVKEGNSRNTGIRALDQINRESGAVRFERIAKVGNNDDLESDLFAWFKVTLTDRAHGPIEIPPGLENAYERINQKIPESQASQILASIITRYEELPAVEDVQFNYIHTVMNVPNDPYYTTSGAWGQSFPDLWGIKKINSEGAWNISTGADSVIVGDIDTGVDRNNPDLMDNMWVNFKEIPGNAKDDDLNGYIDDYYGWDFVNNDNDPMDDHGHGTHTAGTIAAVGNNGVGIVGVNWTAKIMALKFMNASGSGPTSAAVAAMQYAAKMGAKVTSNSWGCSCTDPASADAIKSLHQKGVVSITAAGNDNQDALGFSPANADYGITVAASDANDAKASFSNFGEKIDVAAPGVDILSTRAAGTDMYKDAKHFVPNGDVNAKYYRASGTSMAAPHVAGLAALLLSSNPTLTPEEIRQLIRNGADDLAITGKDAFFGYGRINASQSINANQSQTLTPVITSPGSRTSFSTTSIPVYGIVGGSSFKSYALEVGQGRTPTSWVAVGTSTTQPVTSTLISTLDTNKLPDGNNIIRLTATNTMDKKFQFQVHDITIDNITASIEDPRFINSSPTVVNITGTANAKNGLSMTNYTLEYGQGISPTTWISTGITLNNNGTASVTNGLLATWDTSSLVNNSAYTLRLTVNASNGFSDSVVRKIYVDRDVTPGWPQYSPSKVLHYESPSMGDIDGDGVDEILYAPTQLPIIYVYKKDGSLLPGWPVNVAGNIYTNPFLADVNNDGKQDVIVTYIYTTTSTSGGLDGHRTTVYVLGADGKNLPGWPKTITGLYTKPVVSDLDGDGDMEVITTGSSSSVWTATIPADQYIHVYNADGTMVGGFPKYGFKASGVCCAAVSTIMDLNADGKKEIIIGRGSNLSAGPSDINIFDYQGNIFPGWPKSVAGQLGQVVVGDITGDGKPEIIHKYVNAANTSTFALNILDTSGNQMPNYPSIVPPNYITLALGDITADGVLDIVSANITSSACNPVVFTQNGLIPQSVCASRPVQNNMPALVDYNNDKNLHVAAAGLVNGEYSIHVYKKFFDSSNRLGWNIIWQKNVLEWSHPIISDIDKNGKYDLLAVSAQTDSTGQQTNILFLWELPNSNSSSGVSWAQYMKDSIRSAKHPISNTPVTPVPTSIISNTPVPPSNTPKPTTGATPFPTSVIPTPTLIVSPTGTGSDLIPPVVQIVSPTNNATVPRNKTTTISVSASDNVGVAQVQISVSGKGGNYTCTPDTTAPYTCSWPVPAKPRDAYTISARAYDAVGNASSLQTIQVKSSN